MGKYIKKIENMVDVAERRGESTQGAYNVTHEEDTNTYCLYHYGTMTAKIVAGNIVQAYGIGTSDADSVETFVNLVASNIQGYTNFGYRPVNGGFYANSAGSDTYIYMDEADSEEDFASNIMKEWGFN